MSVQLKIDNFDDGNVLYTDKLDADTTVGAQALQLKSSNGYLANQMLVVGALGTDGCEIVRVQTAPDATHVNLAAQLTLPHTKDDTITWIAGDQIKLYRAANVTGYPPTDDQYAVVTPPSPQTIQFDEQYSYLYDINGSRNYWYKFTYLNSNTSAETNLSDSSSSRGGGVNYYCTVQDIRETAGMAGNQYITDSKIDEKRIEAQAEIDSALNGMYDVPFDGDNIDPMIKGITRLLAAGKLLSDDYGPGYGSMSGEGDSKQAEARSMLQLIQTRQYQLIDQTGVSLLDPNSASSKAFPNAATIYQGPGNAGSDRLFRMGDAAGYGTRKY